MNDSPTFDEKDLDNLSDRLTLAVGLPPELCQDEPPVMSLEDIKFPVAKETGSRPRPHVICLCGSTRFYERFMECNYNLTMRGNIVLSVGFFPHRANDAHGENLACTPKQKQALDELHLRKIDMADEVLVINEGGYIGESTGREILYARAMGKPVRYTEPQLAPYIGSLAKPNGRELQVGDIVSHSSGRITNGLYGEVVEFQGELMVQDNEGALAMSVADNRKDLTFCGTEFGESYMLDHFNGR